MKLAPQVLMFSLLASSAAGQGMCFEPPVSVPGGAHPTAFAPADVDGDGDVDVAVSSHSPAQLLVHLQDGQGGFAAPQAFPLPVSFTKMVAIDLEGDGDTDFVGRDSGLYTIVNAGSGTFSTQTLPLGSSTGLACGDLDGDGDADIVTVQTTGVDMLSVYFQGPIGAFTPLSFSLWQGGPTVLELADIDNDGDLDLFALNTDWDDLRVYRNNGAGLFSYVTSPAVDFVTTDLEIADLDNDGDVDLASVGGFIAPYGVRIFDNLGGGAFASPVTFPIATYGTTLEAGDFDGDGDLDLAADQNELVSLGVYVYRVAVLENLGALAFGAGPLIPWSGRSLAVADVEGDSDVDIVSLHVSQGALHTLLNCSANGVTICAGDGSAVACPCANNGAPGHGCGSSLFAGGAVLMKTGAARVSADTALLRASDMTGTIAVFFQGAAQTPPVIIDDGIGCVGGPIIRLGNKPASGGASSYPQSGDPRISVRGAIPAAGGTFYYQCFYRNAAALFCPPATSNRTNGLAITWIP